MGSAETKTDTRTIAERVRDTVIEHLGIEPDKVTPDARFKDDLGADSLDAIELGMAFEEEFNIEIPDDDVDRLGTCAEVTAYIEKALGVAAA